MITLNVGGKVFLTTSETLSDCLGLNDLVYLKKHSEGDIFLDRDPIVFGKMLKLLRGYPVYPLIVSDVSIDILYELRYWNHKFVSVDVPDWLQPQTLTFHTLDPAQTDMYQKTHGLLPVSSVSLLVKSGYLPYHTNYTKCIIIGATTPWVDCVWVPLKEIELVTVRYQFETFFGNSRLFPLE